MSQWTVSEPAGSKDVEVNEWGMGSSEAEVSK